VDRFFERIGGAKGRALLLDYDGTLAPFREERMQAMPYPEIVEPLNRVLRETDTHVALISGRAIQDLLPLIAAFQPTPELWGSHGWERRDANGRHRSIPLPPPVAVLVNEARLAAGKGGFLDRCEIKPAGIALHWRGRDETEKEGLRRSAENAWNPLIAGAKPGTVELHEFDGGLEFRAAGRNKGEAVRELIAELPPDAAIAYLGDDRTDEDAFAALENRGLCVLVRPEPRPTLAHVWIQPPNGLTAFLTRWLDSCKS
jgi:trehalose-phosphatase